MEQQPTDSDQTTTKDDARRDQSLPLDPEEAPKSDDQVEDSSEDSFPASDPPSFTRSTTD